MNALYIADGHQRSASASRVAAARRAEGAGSADSDYEYFLCVAFPDDEMQILRCKNASGVAEGGFQPSVSDDGRWVAFASTSSALVPGDTNGVGYVFVYSR